MCPDAAVDRQVEIEALHRQGKSIRAIGRSWGSLDVPDEAELGVSRAVLFQLLFF